MAALNLPPAFLVGVGVAVPDLAVLVELVNALEKLVDVATTVLVDILEPLVGISVSELTLPLDGSTAPIIVLVVDAPDPELAVPDTDPVLGATVAVDELIVSGCGIDLNVTLVVVWITTDIRVCVEVRLSKVFDLGEVSLVVGLIVVSAGTGDDKVIGIGDGVEVGEGTEMTGALGTG